MGTTAVLDSKYPVVTQAYSSKPCRSATTRGSALATIELSSADRNTHSMSAPRVSASWRRPICSERNTRARGQGRLLDCTGSLLLWRSDHQTEQMMAPAYTGPQPSCHRHSRFRPGAQVDRVPSMRVPLDARPGAALPATHGRPAADRRPPAPDGAGRRRQRDAGLLPRQRLRLGLRRGQSRRLDARSPPPTCCRAWARSPTRRSAASRTWSTRSA